jgi:hypothetical protein
MNETLNHEGGVVHKLDALETLFSKVLGTFFGEKTFYEKRSTDSEFVDLAETISQVDEADKEYILKIAAIGRKNKMISYPLALLTACFNDERFKGDNFVDEKTGRNKLSVYCDQVVRRTKDILEILAIQFTFFGFVSKKGKRGKNHRDMPIPVQMRKGLKRKLESYDAYKLSKGLGEKSEVSLADAIKILHPSATGKRGELYKSIIEGNLSFGAGKKQVQAELTKAKKSNMDTKAVKESIQYSTIQAIVKNICALCRSTLVRDSAFVESVTKKLTNKKEVENSQLLPFRFYQAHNELKSVVQSPNTRAIQEALVDALELSVANVPEIEGNTCILIDASGSMRHTISEKSTLVVNEVAALLAAIVYKKSSADIVLFATTSGLINYCFSRRDSVMTIMRGILSHINEYGGQTLADKALGYVSDLARKGSSYDNLIILSDNDIYTKDPVYLRYGYGFCFSEGNSTTADKMATDMLNKGLVKKVWINNLQGNDFCMVNTQDPKKNLIVGFSEEILNQISVYNSIGGGVRDIRKVIDTYYDKLFSQEVNDEE